MQAYGSHPELYSVLITYLGNITHMFIYIYIYIYIYTHIHIHQNYHYKIANTVHNILWVVLYHKKNKGVCTVLKLFYKSILAKK